jgi:predicted nuclease of predicted toxin-antitoxin system
VRILIDECLPTRCRTWFSGHEVETVAYRGWKGVLNGALLAKAVDAGFEVLLTADKGMYRQHDLTGLPLAVVVTPTNRLKHLESLKDTIVGVVERTRPGDCLEVSDLTETCGTGSAP